MIELLKHQHAMPAFIICVYTFTAIRYGFAGEWWRVGYWVCAAGITICATWGFK